MKPKTFAGLMIAAGLALPLASHAADSDTDRGSAKAWVVDSVITTKIKTQLAAARISSLAKIHVDTDAKGFVQLTGKVGSKAEAERAIAIARTVEGVTDVDSKLVVTGDK
jgi:hyperosmotically inducible protein